MDTNNSERLKFNSVWQRVTESSDTELSPEANDEILFAALIANEKENYVFYRSVHHLGGGCSSLFVALADSSRRRLGRLQTFYYLMFGNNCATNVLSANKPQRILPALRESYWRESETASKLISAAVSISHGKFSSYGSEFARQAAENAEHIIQIIDRIMK